MPAEEIEIYHILMTRFSAEESGKIVNYVSRKKAEGMNDLSQIFLTKEDKVELITRIENVRSELLGRIENVRSELVSRMDNLDANTNTRIDNLKIDLITRMDNHFRWLVGLLFTITAIMVALIKM
jgi:hypothetical protein